MIIDRYGHREEVEDQINKSATIPKPQVMFCKPVECQGSTWQVRKALRSDCKKRVEQPLRNFEEVEKRHAPKLMGKEFAEKCEKDMQEAMVNLQQLKGQIEEDRLLLTNTLDYYTWSWCVSEHRPLGMRDHCLTKKTAIKNANPYQQTIRRFARH